MIVTTNPTREVVRLQQFVNSAFTPASMSDIYYPSSPRRRRSYP